MNVNYMVSNNSIGKHELSLLR